MVEAYELAAELTRSSDHVEAFAHYQERLGDFLRSKQNAAIRRVRVRAEEQAPAFGTEHGDEVDGAAKGCRSGYGQELP